MGTADARRRALSSERRRSGQSPARPCGRLPWISLLRASSRP